LEECRNEPPKPRTRRRREVSGAITQVPTPVETVQEYYRLLDSGDLDAAFAMFADQAEVRFVDNRALTGRDVIASTVRGMLGELVKSISHEFVRTYVVSQAEGTSTVIGEQIVSYVMLRSGNIISHHGVSISEVDTESGRITAQRIVGDLGPVLADHKAHG
jgi:ketosteroid isomerase-like protein